MTYLFFREMSGNEVEKSKHLLRQLLLFCIFFLCLNAVTFASPVPSDEPDSVYLFTYNTNGLRFAWSTDQKNWTPIGAGHVYLKSDYGRWGSEKKMNSPYLIRGKDGVWVCVWQINTYTPQFASATSKNLINWGPQSYPYLSLGKNVLRPVITYNPQKESYKITYVDADGKYYATETKDFKFYTPVAEVSAAAYQNHTISADIEQKTEGQVHRVPWSVVAELKKAQQLIQYKNTLNNETTKDDAERFADLKPLETKLSAQMALAKPISKLLTGVFFEDINYAADGGLYAELIQNRDFEYHPSDKSYDDKNWNSKYAWSLKGGKATFTVDSLNGIHPNNPHYAQLKVNVPGASLFNTGFDGITVKKGETYHFSAFAKAFEGKNISLTVNLVSAKQGVLAQKKLSISSGSWKVLKTSMISSSNAKDVSLEITVNSVGSLGLDMISLFPEKTYKGRKNGLRADLATTIANIKPKFVRFPGGCVAHGDGIANIYKWKNSIGPLESRKPDRNLWGYHQTMGLGYFEYFQFCEDIGAEPVPVIAAGVPCQNSGTGGGGQQGGIPMSEMPQYIQDIIDLVEYANGAINTKWGKKRAEAGHPKPFALKYIGIGNEDQITEVFKERFTMIYNALQKAHPEITVIGSAGPFFEGTDYEEGWKIGSDLKVPILDEHYYQSPGWFINNQDFYDQYDRNKSKVYLGEYAASLPGGNRTNWETSLSEALYLTSLERNGDVVSMASYAPLLAKEGHTQWNPDLIYFNNDEVKPTPGYYVQKIYGQNAGDQYIPADLILTDQPEKVRKRIAYSIVKDSETNSIIIKIVNLLPVSVNTTIDLGEVKIDGIVATKTTLAGKPTDKTVTQTIDLTTLKKGSLINLPAYSFTMVRFVGN
jgi:alpha-L-arabinofuranosidase